MEKNWLVELYTRRLFSSLNMVIVNCHKHLKKTFNMVQVQSNVHISWSWTSQIRFTEKYAFCWPEENSNDALKQLKLSLKHGEMVLKHYSYTANGWIYPAPFWDVWNFVGHLLSQMSGSGDKRNLHCKRFPIHRAMESTTNCRSEVKTWGNRNPFGAWIVCLWSLSHVCNMEGPYADGLGVASLVGIPFPSQSMAQTCSNLRVL